jgi:hypothetical protein
LANIYTSGGGSGASLHKMGGAATVNGVNQGTTNDTLIGTTPPAPNYSRMFEDAKFGTTANDLQAKVLVPEATSSDALADNDTQMFTFLDAADGYGNITYQANYLFFDVSSGSDPAPEPKLFQYATNTLIRIPSYSGTKGGSSFTNWNENQSGDGKSYTPNTTEILNLTDTTIIYAIFQPQVTNLDLTSKFTSPQIGNSPQTNFADSQYEGTVLWVVTGSGGTFTAFEAGKAYTAIVTLTAAPGYTFAGVLPNTFTYNGVSSIFNAQGTGTTIVVTVNFPSL